MKAEALLAGYRGRRVLVTGDTGFKGAWLAWWLARLGARVHGLALPPEHAEGPYVLARLAETVAHADGDVRDAAAVRRAVDAAAPEVIFHLAAQALVRESYRDPAGTVATNVLGTAHVLDAVRAAGRPCAVVVVTSDKCYENREWEFAYRENDALGGHDVYSASKGCAELVTAAFRRSFFAASGGAPSVRVASARAGNVIGPGDWAADRIVPDIVRALRAGRPVAVRNPRAVRPWQHVLEPLAGYLRLGAALLGDAPEEACGAWNFGPQSGDAHAVEDLVRAALAAWGGGAWEDASRPGQPHEAAHLRLAIDKAVTRLGWRPVWPFAETVRRTVAGYRRLLEAPADAHAARRLMDGEIAAYLEQAAG